MNNRSAKQQPKVAKFQLWFYEKALLMQLMAMLAMEPLMRRI